MCRCPVVLFDKFIRLFRELLGRREEERWTGQESERFAQRSENIPTFSHRLCSECWGFIRGGLRDPERRSYINFVTKRQMIHPWELDDGALLPTFNYDYADARDPRWGGIVWLNESTTTTVPTDDRWTTQTLCPSQWSVGCWFTVQRVPPPPPHRRVLSFSVVRKRLRKTLQKTKYVSIARGKEDSLFFHAIMPERSLLGLLINCTTDVGRKKGPLCENCAESPFAFPPLAFVGSKLHTR